MYTYTYIYIYTHVLVHMYVYLLYLCLNLGNGKHMLSATHVSIVLLIMDSFASSKHSTTENR